ncbi:hypothetical protein [Luteibacter sp. dw_328]|uniref:hypothetical protein n=1 Tax=Luteibacter sp. dw_328 TaxID=2719796 RepID=UPI001BD2A2B5|nr:hypothetical protein [Luteibacter sp. dw_328]
MTEKEPDWDRLMAGITLGKLHEHAPAFGAFERVPVFSPKREWLLLASLDIAVRTGDLDELKSVLPQLADKYSRSAREGGHQYKYAFQAWVEFVAVCSLLSGLDMDVDDYRDPDELLARLVESERVRRGDA